MRALYTKFSLSLSLSLCVHMQVRLSEEEKGKIWSEIWQCRKALAVEHRMLQEPPDKGNFLTTTLRRYNRARLERLNKAREEKDFEKIYKQSFWSYSKSVLKQPLTVLEGEKGGEMEDTALKLFYTILQHAGECPGRQTLTLGDRPSK